jgi:hypothetical protein
LSYDSGMGATALSLDLEARSEESDLDQEAWEELFYEVHGLLTDYLEENLRRPAEAGFLEDIDAGCVVEANCDDFENGRLTFLFGDSWPIGAEAAEHWYALAMAACRDQVEQAVGERGFTLTSPVEDVAELARKGTGGLPLLAIGNEIVGVYENGELSVTEGVNLELSEDDRARVQEVARTRRCECELCQRFRGHP